MNLMRMALAVAAMTSTVAALAQDCPYPAAPNDRQALFRLLSANAEAVAPTAPAKRRAVSPGRAVIANAIDAYVVEKRTSACAPTETSGDEEFLRRVSLDLTGAIPDAAAVVAFTDNRDADKRAKLVDRLLASDAFTDRWTLWFGDLTQNVRTASSIDLFYPGRNAWHAWIRERIAARAPYDAMVRELLTGTGSGVETPAPNYVARQFVVGPPHDIWDNTATTSFSQFLGIRTLCVSCHDGAGHLEAVNWYLRGRTRRQLWETAAFFSRTKLSWKNSPDPLDANRIVSVYSLDDQSTGAYELNTVDGNRPPRTPRAGEVATVLPAFLLTGETPRANEPWREAYARMLTSHRQFARTAVNRLWKEMLGVGLVEPLDGFDLTKLDTQPTHPRLLEALADHFIASGYDLRALLRLIALSNTYQLSSRYTPGPWSEACVPQYARHYPTRLPAEMIYDAVAKATAVREPLQVRGGVAVERAIQLPDPSEPDAPQSIGRFLDELGRGNRDLVERNAGGSILQSLRIMNDRLITNGIAGTEGTVGRVLRTTSDLPAVADEIYLHTLSRRPTETEREIAVAELREGPLRERAEDLQYALLNSLEFLFR